MLYNYFFQSSCAVIFDKDFEDLCPHVKDVGLCVWAPTQPGESLCQSLQFLINACEVLRTTTTEKHICFYLVLMQNACLPLATWINRRHTPCTDALLRAKASHLFPGPDMVHARDTLSSCFSMVQNLGFWSMTDIKRDPFTHVASKTLPHRCLVRNMGTMTHDYMEKHEDLRSFLLDIVLCTYTGGFSKETRPVPFAIRYDIYDAFYWTGAMEKWVTHKFSFIVYAIKHFVRHGVALVPSLHDILVEKNVWGLFDVHLKQSLDIFYDAFHAPKSTWRGVLGKMLPMIKSHVAKHMNFTKQTRGGKMKTTLRLARQLTAYKDHHDVLCSYFTETYNALCRVPHDAPVPWKLLLPYGVPRVLLKTLYDPQATRKDLRRYLVRGDGTVTTHGEQVRQFIRMWDYRLSVRCFQLPHHYKHMQMKTMRRMYGLTRTEEVPRAAYRFLVCTRCDTVKSVRRKPKKKNDPCQAFGNQSVLVDDETLQIYCAQNKSNKESTPVKKTGARSFLADIHEALAKKRRLKKERRQRKYEQCANTPLLSIYSHGMLLEVHKKLYMLCPHCLNTTCLATMTFKGGLLVCEGCKV